MYWMFVVVSWRANARLSNADVVGEGWRVGGWERKVQRGEEEEESFGLHLY